MNDVLIDGITNIDDDLIEKYFNLKTQYLQKKRKFGKAIKLGLVAASFCVIIISAILSIYMLNTNDTPSMEVMNRPYKNLTIVADETMIVWPWEYKTIFEKYIYIDINGVTYSSHMQEVDSNHVGRKIGTFVATGYDDLSDSDDSIFHSLFEVYEITNVSQDRLITVKMDGKYYAFETELYSPPSTIGELFDEYGLTTSIELNNYYYSSSNNDSSIFLIKDDEAIWKILSDYNMKESVDPIGWHETKREGIKFVVNSKCLGINNKTIFVTSDGYIWMDVFNGEYLYFIGEDASQRIIAYVNGHSTKEDIVVYDNAVIGNIVEITEDYILVDDSMFCENSKDGIIFKIPISTVYIQRYVEMNYIGVGDTVRIDYSDAIYQKTDYVISDVYSLAKVFVTENAVIMP